MLLSFLGWAFGDAFVSMNSDKILTPSFYMLTLSNADFEGFKRDKTAMANNRSICPRCNNYVEGRKISSFKGKAARTAAKALVKEGSKDIVEFGTIGAGAAAGAAIGSIIPGIGTAIGATIGGVAGWVGKALANDAIGKTVDQATDYLEDEYTEVVYQYSCPKCGYSWTSEEED